MTPQPCSVQLPRRRLISLVGSAKADIGAVVAQVGELEGAAVPVDAGVRARDAWSRRCRTSPAGCARAPPASAGRRRRGSGPARPGGCPRARATGSTVAELRGGRGVARARRRPSTCTCTGSARPRRCIRSRLRKRARWSLGRPASTPAGDECFVVAGVVEQPRGHVDCVAEAVARHLDHLAARQRDLQAQRRAGRPRRRVRARATPMRSSSSCIWLGRRAGRPSELSNTAIRPSPSVLINWPSHLGDRARQHRRRCA